MKTSVFFAFTLALPLQSAAAGFENSADRYLSELRRSVEMRQQELVGKTFYGYFDRRSCRYPWDPAIQGTPTFLDRNRYTADAPKRFVIDGIVPSQTRGHETVIRYYRVKIEDGSIGYIDVSKFRSGNPEKEESLRDDCLFELEPQEVQARLDKFASEKRAKFEAQAEERRKADERAAKWEAERQAEQEVERKKQEAMAKRPGARIGMTAKEVIEKTNWGKPESINRTVTRYGVEEQWIYGLGTYLYFTNGRLTAIQN
jgi:hypothetical protein